MQILSASEARANLYRLMDQAAESHQPITIAGKRHDAVLVSAEDWQAIQETLFLLAVPGMRETIKEGMAEPIDACAKGLESQNPRAFGHHPREPLSKPTAL